MAEQDAKKQVRVVMWCTPRSLSTAIFRAMWNKKSCKCLPEPYTWSYQLSEERVSNMLAEIPHIEGFNYLNVKKEMYEGHFDEDEVFAKDFPFNIFGQKKHNPADLIPQGYVNMFLLRTPKACFQSAYKVFLSKKIPTWTEWDSSNAGFKAMLDMYNTVKEFQPDPLVIVAEDVVKNPEASMRLICERTGLKFEEGMLNWKEDDGLKAKMDEAIPFFAAFNDTVMSATGFLPSHSKAEVELPPQILLDIEEANQYYNSLLQFATRIPPPTQS